jgi:hypothetical protein
MSDFAGDEFDFFDEEGEKKPELSVADITEAEKYEFLQLIYQGYNRQEAAKSLGYKARCWRSLCSPRSLFYDEDFANAYADAAHSPENQSNFLERLRAETTRRALTDSDQLLTKMMMVHDPEWSVLRQKDVRIDVHAVLEQRLGMLSAEQLRQLLAWMDEGKAISEHPLIDQAPKELGSGDDGDSDS